MDSSLLYAVSKAIHIIAVVVFLGNILITAAWKLAADRTGQRSVIEFAQRLVTETDFVFTGPAAVVLLLSGLSGVYLAGFSFLETQWVLIGLLLFAGSGLIWVGLLIPTQVRQSRLLAETEGEDVPAEYFVLCRRWTRAGIIANVLPIVGLIVMVMKPV